jgi:hypothetical protein
MYLLRQARALAQRTGGPFVEVLGAVLETPAGMQLEELRCGPQRDEETRYWQANLLFERVSRLGILYTSCIEVKLNRRRVSASTHLYSAECVDG